MVLVLYGGLLWMAYQKYQATPKGFVPSQDMGYLLVSVQLDDSASLERTDAVIRQVEAISAKEPGIRFTTAIIGQSFVLNAIGSNFATVFFGLKDYADRRDPSLYSDMILGRMRAAFGKEIVDAQVQVFPPPPVRGVGRAGGFTLMIEDRNDAGLAMLQSVADGLVARTRDPKENLGFVFTSFRANVPQLRIEPDNRECMTKGVALRDFADTLQVYEGSLYVNDFNLFGRTWQVIVQAESRFRDQLEDLNKLKVRNQNGAMVPLGAVSNVIPINGPLVLNRYNMYPAASIMGGGGKNVSSGEAIAKMRKLAEDELPPSMAFEWSEMSYLELAAANTAIVIFGFAVVMVFLVLAAQYESWSLPLAIILVVPTCIYSALVGVNLMHLEINIFTQVGFVVLVGLASKNAILIVEFAKQQRDFRPHRPPSHARRLPAAAATDCHDQLGVYSGSVAAGDRHRRRRRDAPRPGRRRVQRNGRGHAVWFGSHAGILLQHRLARRHLDFREQARDSNRRSVDQRDHPEAASRSAARSARESLRLDKPKPRKHDPQPETETAADERSSDFIEQA